MEVAGRERLCIHTVTHKPWSLARCCEGFARAGVPALTVWRQQVEPVGLKEATRIVRGSGLRVTSLCRGGFFAAQEAAGREAALEENRRVIDEAAELGAPLVVLVCGAVPGMDLGEARRQIAEGIAVLVPQARASGVKLAVEPLHPVYAADRSAVNTVAQARAICEEVNEAGGTDVGVAVDVYHVWWDDTLESEIARLGERGWLHAFHVCDWKVAQRDVLNDRGLMGEGVIALRKIRGWVEVAGFRGDIEVEVFSERYWGMEQEAYLGEILQAYDKHV